MLMEQLEYNLLFRWFVGLSANEPVWHPKEFPTQEGQDINTLLPPPPSDPGRNPALNYRKQKRSNVTHASTTDPFARLLKKSKGSEAKICYLGRIVTENRNGLGVDARLTLASGTAERETAIAMIENKPAGKRVTLGAD